MRAAWARVRCRPWLILALAALNLLFAYAAAQPLSAGLQPVMDLRPAAEPMIHGDDGLFGELLSDHGGVFAAAGAAAQTALLFYGLLSWLLAGGLIARLVLLDEGGLGDVLAASVRSAGRMLKVGALGLVVRLAPIGLGVAVSFALRPLYRSKGFTQLVTGSTVLFALVAFAWAFTSVTLDYARTLALADPSLGTPRAVGRAIKLALRRAGATATIAAFSLAAWGGVTLFHAWLAHVIPAASTSGYVVLGVVRVAAAILRAGITVWVLVWAGRLAAARSQTAPAPGP